MYLRFLCLQVIILTIVKKKIEPHCIQKVNLLLTLYLKDCLITKRHVSSKKAEGR